MKIIAKNFALGLGCLLLVANHAAQAADRDYLEDSDFTKTVAINFNGTSATVLNGAGVTISQGANASYIAITSTIEGVEYVLSGTSADGYVQITSTYASKVTLNGVNLTSTNGPALSMISAARNFVVTAENSTNSLADTTNYTRAGSGTLYGSGPLIFSGKGSVTVAGIKSHAIYSGSYIRALGGDVIVTTAVKDALHSKGFQMDQGTITATATGDGIDADTGTIAINGGSINIRSTVDDTKGIVCDGTLTVNGGSINLTVNGAQSKGFSNKTAMAINGGTVLMNLAGNVALNTVTSGTTTYTDPSYCTGIKCGGALTITDGTVVITHTGIAGKGVTSDGNMTISGGNVDVSTSGGPSSTYTNSAGATDYASADGLATDGILTVSNGTITVLSTGDAGDSISSDLAMNISGGTFNITNKGNRSKGLKCSTDLTVTGGAFNFAMSGAVVLAPTATAGRFNPDYCTALKCGSLTFSNASVTITHTGLAGKGISVDLNTVAPVTSGNASITSGTINVTASGNASATFTNSAGATDIAAADCLKADGTLSITGGNVTASSTGTGGDAISCDGAAVFGTAGVTGTPVITAGTSGARILVSGSNYANCKAFSAGGNLTMNEGVYRGTTTTNGGEGMESKANLVVNGGLIEITSYDDGINAASSITINGGLIYSYASNNDGLDSNGTIRITGGMIVPSGAAAPEEGFDCDNNNFTITGGILAGTGGATSTPTAATSTQNTILYRGTGTANAFIVVKNSAGTPVHVQRVPRTYSGATGMTMLINNANLPNGTYTLVTGATVTGGTEFHGLYTGATVTGGTVARTFTISARVTTVQ